MTSIELDQVARSAVWEWLSAEDGTRFRVARFGSSNAPRGTVVILNGRTEFVEKYFEVIGDLLQRDYAVASLDWRGQGMSDRALDNRHKGHVKDFDLYVSDLRQAISAFIEPGCPPPFRALCHSMGGNIGLRYIGEFPETFESAVFSAPMWGIGKAARTPGWMRMVSELTYRLGLGDAYIPGGKDYNDADRAFADNILTHDPVRFARFVAHVSSEPQLELGAPTLLWAREAMRSMDLIHAPGFAEAIGIPILVCSAGADALVSVAAQRLVADRLPNAKQVVVAGSKHELLMELDEYRDQFYTAFDAM